MSKQDDDLAELQKFFDQEISKIETSQPKKGEDKKSLTETAPMSTSTSNWPFGLKVTEFTLPLAI